MTEEEYFRKNYPDFCYGDRLLSPYWDFFQDGVEFGERESEKKIKELEIQIKKIKQQNEKWHEEYKRALAKELKLDYMILQVEHVLSLIHEGKYVHWEECKVLDKLLKEYHVIHHGANFPEVKTKNLLHDWGMD